MAIEIVDRYERPPFTGCQNNCVTILRFGEPIPPLPDHDVPPEGMEWVYDSDGKNVYDSNNLKVYTSIIS